MSVNRKDRGSAFLLCLVILIVIVGISGAYLGVSLINSKKTNNDMFALQALYLAESGAAVTIQELNTVGGNPSAMSAPASVGGGTYQVTEFLSYGSDGIDNDGDGDIDNAYEESFVRMEVEGKFTDQIRRLEVILSRSAGGVYWNAVFAGNASGDPAYTLDFGGTSDSIHDEIRGDVYSGGSITSGGYAEFLNENGTRSPLPVATYANSYTDSSTTNEDPIATQGTQSALAIPPGDMDASVSRYEERTRAGDPNYVDVARELDETRAGSEAALGTIRGETLGTGSYTTNPDGSEHGGANCGQAVQIAGTNAANNPAHIFRKNPTDMNGDGTLQTQTRAERWFGQETSKEDYFLEDPTQYARKGFTTNENNAQLVDLGPNANDKVFFINGNLWANNSPTYTFKFLHSEPNMRNTFVVKGNLYLSDNLYYHDDQTDALAIIAIEDPLHPNVSPGDFASTAALPNGDDPAAFASSVGVADITSVEGMADAARLYNRLHGSGNIFFGDPVGGTTERFEAFMYAQNNFYDNNLGASRTNKTDIYGNMTAGNQVLIERDFDPYKPLEVTFDDKIKSGRVVPPELPETPGFGSGDWFIASWKQVP